MSKQLIETFFPAVVERIQQYPSGRKAWVSLFPADVNNLCPEASVQILRGRITIRQPSLLAGAIVGMAIGFSGAIEMLGKCRKPFTSIHRRETDRLWSLSLFAFGLMNLSAAYIHSILPTPMKDYPRDTPCWWMMDTYSTGVSASCILFACMADCQRTHKQAAWTVLLWFFVVTQALGIMCVLWFSLTGNPTASTYPLELWYLIPPLLAGPPLLYIMFRDYQASKNWSYVWAIVWLILGGSIGLGGVLADAALCRRFEGKFFDSFTTGSLMFWGCDIAFLGVLTRSMKAMTSGQSVKPE